jgi:hypothetical protein
MTAIAGYLGAVYLASAPSIAFTNEAMTDSGDHLTYTITVSSKRYWDNTKTFTVESSVDGASDWTVVSSDAYKLQYIGGVIIFTSAQTSFIRVSGYYFPYTQIGDGHEWEVQLDLAVVDVSVFGSPWRTQLSTIKSASGKFSKYWNDASFMGYLSSPMIFVLYVSTVTGTRYEGYGYIKQDSLKNDETSVMMEDVSFEISGQLYCVNLDQSNVG